MSSVRKNIVYNIFYQILAIILPLITAPYVSRVLGAEGVGIYSYTYSVANYFLLFAMLGINNHGNRSIAAEKHDKFSLGKCFINNYIIQLFVGLLSVTAYIIYVTCLNNDNIIYAYIQLLTVISAVFDINWFFWGIEKFKITVIRNTICKILSVICIFVFVRTPADLWKYVLLMSMTMLISQLILWKFIAKEIYFVKPDFSVVKKNIKPILVLFIPILSYSLYRIMDKIMIGSFANMNEVGYYENAEKILNIPIGIITALGNVMLPRISNLLSHGDTKSQIRYINLSMKFVSIVDGALCFGIASISRLFAPIYYGNEFIRTGEILSIIIFTALISGWANIIRTQFLIPKKMDTIYVISMLSAAVVNFILNIIFIPRYGAMGAVIGTVSAEVIVLLIQGWTVRYEINWIQIIRENYIYIIDGTIMLLGIRIVDRILTFKGMLKLIIEVLIGSSIYIFIFLLCSIIARDELYKIGSGYIRSLFKRES